MSGEFGSYYQGYFGYQMQVAADDCKGGRYEITRRWGAVLEAFAGIADAIAMAEAGDTDSATVILETMEDLEGFKNALRELERYIEPFSEVARRAIRSHSDI